MKLFLFLAMIAGVAAIIVASGNFNQPAPTEASTETAESTRNALDRVTAGKPVRKTLKLYTSQPARIEAFEEAPLHSKLSGYVEQVLVDIGDAVQKGQVLIKLSIPEMLDDVKQKEALLAQATAEVQQAEAAVRAAKAAVDTARARVLQAEAGTGRAAGELDRSKAEYERMKELAAKSAVTQKLVDETLNQYRAAEAARDEAAATVQTARAALNEAEANVYKAQADQMAAEARERVSQADLSRAKTLLAYTEIKAPFDGVVTRRGVDTGHYVHPANDGTKALMTVLRTDKVRVFVDVPEMEAAFVDGGDTPDPAIVRVQSLGGREYQATVTRHSMSLDVSNRSLRTEIDIPNEDGVLRPGMYATASILLEQRDDVLTLPASAIVREGRDTYCCCVVAGKIDRKPVTLGLRAGDDVEIVSGLDADQLVVLARGASLQQGQPVEIITADQ